MTSEQLVALVARVGRAAVAVAAATSVVDDADVGSDVESLTARSEADRQVDVFVERREVGGVEASESLVVVA